MAISPYWCEQRLTVDVDGPGVRSSIPIHKPFARIGAHPASEVVLAGDDIPRRCFYLHGTNHGVFWIGLSGSQPAETVVGGWMQADKPLCVGSFRITARLADTTAVGPPPGEDWLAKGSAAAPFPVIMISGQGRSLGQRMLTRRLTVVGRRKPATLGLSSLSVSICHCILYWHAGELWAVDLLSRNGITLEDRPTEAARIPEKGSLKLGVFELAFLSLSNSSETKYAMSQVQSPEIPSSSGIHLDTAEDAEAEEMQRQQDAEWRRRWSQLEAESATLAEEKEDFERMTKEWEQERSRMQLKLSSESGEFEERRRRFETERDVFRAQKALWEAERAGVDQELERRRKQLDEEAKRAHRERQELQELRAELRDQQQAGKG